MVKNPLRDWMNVATSKEKEELARLARTTVGTLQQHAGGYRHRGRVQMTSALAGRVAEGSRKIAREGLPAMCREDLSPICATCEHVKQQG